jgi:sulfur carrier protein
VKVRVRHQRREVELHGPGSVRELLQRLDLNPETVIVIRQGELLTGDASLDPDDEIEIRPVVSGGGGKVHALHDV